MTSSYYLAVDVGTSRTAAATARLAPDGTLLATPFPLGRTSDAAPSAMFVGRGDLLFGDAAERRGLIEPERLVREFKRRIGDNVPIIAGDRRFTAEQAFALVVAWVVDLVSERESRLPTAIAVTVPVAWGEYRHELVEDALARHGWSSVTLVSEPEAAARHYESTSPLPSGAALAVYDLGGGTLDAVVLQKNDTGDLRIVGAPVGLHDVGGTDFDDRVLRHALATAGVNVRTATDQKMALVALRRECVDAKESLSFDSEAVIPVLLGDAHRGVRLTRDEFEGMIQPLVLRTTEALGEAIASAGIRVDDVRSILLTGGSSRIPFIAQVLSECFDRPIAVDADPKAIIALGAVRVLSDRAAAAKSEQEHDAPTEDAAASEADRETRSTHVLTGREGRHGRRWRLPTSAYVFTVSAVVGVGLVVASATAVADGGRQDVDGMRSTNEAQEAASTRTSGSTPRPAGPVRSPSATPSPTGAAPPGLEISTPSTPNLRRGAGSDLEPVSAMPQQPTPVARRDIPITRIPSISSGSISSGSISTSAGASAQESGSTSPNTPDSAPPPNDPPPDPIPSDPTPPETNSSDAPQPESTASDPPVADSTPSDPVVEPESPPADPGDGAAGGTPSDASATEPVEQHPPGGQIPA